VHEIEFSGGGIDSGGIFITLIAMLFSMILKYDGMII
jgi:hypothetical protein